MKILVTGAAGFIGSAVVRHLLDRTSDSVIAMDALTYAASPDTLILSGVPLDASSAHERVVFERADIRDEAAVAGLFERHAPDAVLHLAAETHVDRSIDAPGDFVTTNVVGTLVLLEAARRHWEALPADRRDRFRFLHVSTDEVFGSLGPEGHFSETSPYAPNSPYSASKASSDHLVRAWHATYGLPTLLSNCSNNYGPFQFPEKLIPLVLLNALEGLPLPVYGAGANVRDWLYVEDHAEALHRILCHGRPGERYNVGGGAELRNIDVVRTICRVLDERNPAAAPHERLIAFVDDRPGHDLRYAIDAGKIARELGWTPKMSFEEGLRHTVSWYADHPEWWTPLRQRGASRRVGRAARSAEPGTLKSP